ncbi:MAG: sugar phosphate isomerase/epimerase [Defluviitaleaceae bacterium]|nr:sugar phosphate isomerase/epimerase [Defluviitaleaceae bacterium]MCL2275020.1 sugar phosphate isomerase/epimerase [Defluviitaleaceae bacterium]
MEKCYIQLYSLKDEVAKSIDNTLKCVAEVGYTGVEFYGGVYGGHSAASMKKLLADLHLEPLSSHLMTEHVPSQLDYASELGIKYIIDPMYSFSTEEEALKFAEKLNETGKLCAARGIQFGYHNHRHEFLPSSDGTLMDTLIKNTDPAYVCFQLDVGWATCSGIDAPTFIAKYPGRTKLIHVKECSEVSGPEKPIDWSAFPKDADGRPQIPAEILEKFRRENGWNVEAGKGIINWNAVKEAALAQGAQGFIVEREHDYANDIYRCVEEDYTFLKAL